MKLTRTELYQIYNSLSTIGQKDLDCWFEVAKNLRKLKPFMTEYMEGVNMIRDKYGIKEGEGEQSKFKTKIVEGKDTGTIDFGDNESKAMKAFSELDKETVEVEFHIISLDKLKYTETSKEGVKTTRTDFPSNVMESLIDTVIFSKEDYDKEIAIRTHKVTNGVASKKELEVVS